MSPCGAACTTTRPPRSWWPSWAAATGCGSTRAARRELSVGDQQRVEILARAVPRRGAADPRRADRGAHAPGGGRPVPGGARAARGGQDGRVHQPQAREVLEVADSVTVMRDGQRDGDPGGGGHDAGELARLMVGRDVQDRPEPARRPGAAALAVQAWPGRGSRASIWRCAGRDRGRGGRDGQRQTELAETLAGLLPVAAGTVGIGGPTSPARAWRNGARRASPTSPTTATRGASRGRLGRGQPRDGPQRRAARPARVARSGPDRAPARSWSSASTWQRLGRATPPRRCRAATRRVVIARELAGNGRRSWSRSRRAGSTSARPSSCTPSCCGAATRCRGAHVQRRPRRGAGGRRPDRGHVRRPDRRRIGRRARDRAADGRGRGERAAAV